MAGVKQELLGNYAALCGEMGVWCGCGEVEGGSAKPHRLKSCAKVEKTILSRGKCEM